MTEPKGPSVAMELIEDRAKEQYEKLAAGSPHLASTSWDELREGQKRAMIQQARDQLQNEQDAPEVQEHVGAIFAKLNGHFDTIGEGVGGIVAAVSALAIPLAALVDKLKAIEDEQGRGFWMTHGEVETDAWVTEVARLRDEIDLQL